RPSLISAIEPAREPFNTSTLAHSAAIAALDDQAFIHECREKNRAGLSLFTAFCKQHDLSYYETQANFILIDFKQSGDDVFHFLLKNGYIVRSGEALGFPTCVRITIGNQAENKGIISLLTTWLENS